jgi:hypothetical protein
MIDIVAEFQPLLGLHAWGVQHGYGSFVTMEFGEPELKIITRLMPTELEGEPSRIKSRSTQTGGQWHLWIYCCDWSISLNGIQMAHSESEDVQINRAVDVLDGQILTKVSVTGLAHTKFEFDLGGVLTTWPSPTDSYDGEDVEQWYLYEPNKHVLALRSDGYVSLDPGSRTEEEHDWFPRTLSLRKPDKGSS